MLDPFVLLLLDCLNSMHVKVPGWQPSQQQSIRLILIF